MGLRRTASTRGRRAPRRRRTPPAARTANRCRSASRGCRGRQGIASRRHARVLGRPRSEGDGMSEEVEGQEMVRSIIGVHGDARPFFLV